MESESLIFPHFVVFWPFNSAKNAIQSDAPEGSDILMAVMRGNRAGELWLIIWDKVKVPLQSDAPEESDLRTAWQLFPLDADQTCHSKDWVGDQVGVELLYNSVKTEVRQLEIRRSYRRDVVGKATPGRRGSREPRWSLGTREVADKMQ